MRFYQKQPDFFKKVKLKPEMVANSNQFSWIDICAPKATERKLLQRQFGIDLPNPTKTMSLEESTRFYIEDGVIFLTIFHLYITEHNKLASIPISLVIHKDYLISSRPEPSAKIESFIRQITKPNNQIIKEDSNPLTLSLHFIDVFIENLGNLIELASKNLETISAELFYNESRTTLMTHKDFRLTLQKLGREGSYLSKVREHISRTKRAISYLFAHSSVDSQINVKKIVTSLNHDIDSLETYCTYLSSKINFLLDTVIGLISTEQNSIIKIFSVGAVVFLPPTLIASIYGMNFNYMPELEWVWSYPIVLIIMLLSAIVPLWYFKRKGWL